MFYSRGCVATLTVMGIVGVNVGTPWKVTSVIPVKFRPDDCFLQPIGTQTKQQHRANLDSRQKTDDPYIYIYAGIAPSGNTNALNGTVSWIYIEPDDLES